MNSPEKPDPRKETVFLHHLSPELEQELMRRARRNGNDPDREATEIIEQHVEENDSDLP
jgi:hypothetical protein